ncbi:MAG: hypothetical protein KDA41_16290, partial [Planctomycetales bacterium]|nr:hypothetical protein [Planctomycetales bacterium]
VDHPFDPDWPDVFLIVQAKCIGCHRAGNTQELCDLSTYAAIIGAKDWEGSPLVRPGAADDSSLFTMCQWNVHAQRDSDLPGEPEMPPQRSEWLTAGQLQTLRRWINNGALEYKLPDTCSPRPLIESDFPSAKVCKSCHPNQYKDWSRSMHAYAQHSPVFEAFNLTLIERTGGTIGTFCSRCHTPIGTSVGENESRRNVNRSRMSREGITCVVCHRRSARLYKSSGRVPIEPGHVTDSCVYGPFADADTSVSVGGHHSQALPYIKTSQFCGECHDVFSPEGVRLEEAFSEWQNSPAAKEGITCQQCHMGPVQGVPIADCDRPLGRAAVVPGVMPETFPLRHLTDHTFAGPDYSLLPDTEFPEKLDWMYEIDYRDPRQLTPYHEKTLADLRRGNREQLRKADEKRYELLANAAEISVAAPCEARAGRTAKLHVDVHNKVAGHSFPTGFTAERQLWVSVVVRDPAGEVVFASGDLDENGDLRDEHSHEVLVGHIPHDRSLLNFQNKFIALSNKGTDRSVVISVNRNLAPLNVLRPATGISASFGRPGVFRIAKGSLPPLATIGQDYDIGLPGCPGEYTYCVRLNFRHLPPTLLDHIGTPHLKPLLEVVVIDQREGIIHVTP